MPGDRMPEDTHRDQPLPGAVASPGGQRLAQYQRRYGGGCRAIDQPSARQGIHQPQACFRSQHRWLAHGFDTLMAMDSFVSMRE
jgi:hypothetical protein